MFVGVTIGYQDVYFHPHCRDPILNAHQANTLFYDGAFPTLTGNPNPTCLASSVQLMV